MTTKGTDKIQKSGCDCESHQVIVTPTLITTPINTPVIVRYDASSICWKQSIFDPVTGEPHPYVDGVGNNSVIGNITLGTVQWEVGSVFNLPLE